MEAHLWDWLQLVVRWFHVIAGVAWIGASFYFNWLDLNLRPPDPPKDGVKGEVWSVHGGGFYLVEKFEVAPEKLPEKLHWFKWEAYMTWISGFTLLILVYYLGAESFLIDPQVRELTSWQAISIGLATLAGGWIIYDLMCRSPLADKPVTLSVLGFGLAVGLAWFLTEVFSGRGAYIHVGAVLGTIMAANVFFIIIPNQKKMVAAMLEGREPDPALGKAGKLRSFHNNYITLPVLFIMISNHYPLTYGHEWNWAILAAISVLGAGVRHWFNLRNQGHLNRWILPVAAVGMVALAFVSKPPEPELSDEPVAYGEVAAVFAKRCNSCHSENPTDEVWKEAPLGVKFDTPAEIAKMQDKIYDRVVVTKTMPLGNQTGITEEERALIGRWIKQGAVIPTE